MNAGVVRDLKVNTVIKRNVLIIVLDGDYVKIKNVYARKSSMA